MDVHKIAVIPGVGRNMLAMMTRSDDADKDYLEEAHEFVKTVEDGILVLMEKSVDTKDTVEALKVQLDELKPSRDKVLELLAANNNAEAFRVYEEEYEVKAKAARAS